MIDKINEIKKRIEYTGRTIFESEKKAMFKHLVITEEELQEIEKHIDIEDLAQNEDLEIDFISVKKKGKINVIHCANSENKEEIYNNGIKLNYGDKTWISDLGNRGYFVESTNFEAVENLENYIKEMFEDGEELIICYSEYEGEYNECIYGYNHCGYVCIEGDTIDVYDIKNISIGNFINI